MNTYRITLFVLGLNPRLNSRVEYVDAETEEKAENAVRGDGWGVLKTDLMDETYKDFTTPQVEGVKARIGELLGFFMTDSLERNEVVDALLKDVLTDISETADWSDLEGDEYCEGDIDIALARVVRAKICGED